ncbi:MAG: flavodoxin family protein [Acidimicrobiales bacterium]
MKALVIYESMYGNTNVVATAIASGLGACGEVKLGSVSETKPESVTDFDVLVIGGPTHMYGMSRSGTRKAAAEVAAADDDIDIEPGAEGPGLREWFGRLPDGKGKRGAAFDTRAEGPALVYGSAAKGIARRLRRNKYRPITDPESFFIEDSEGPLKDGEVERARRWGAELGEKFNALENGLENG